MTERCQEEEGDDSLSVTSVDTASPLSHYLIHDQWVDAWKWQRDGFFELIG